MTVYIIFGIAAVIAIIMCVKICIQSKAEHKLVQEMQENHRDAYTYDSADHSLHIRQKHPRIVKLLRIDNHTINQYSNVSGKPNATEAKQITTNKCIILMKELSPDFFTDKIVMKEREVHNIYLTEALLEAAKHSTIGQYIDGDKIVVVEETDTSVRTAAHYKTGDMLGAVNSLQRDQSEGYPSLKKCAEIMEWLKENMK